MAFFDELLKEFPVKKKLVYLNNASVSPLPVRVFNAMKKFYLERIVSGDLAWEEWIEKVEETRKLAAKLIDSKPEEIAFVKNTTEGINIVANGLNWKRGDKVITSDLEFTSNFYPWIKLRSKGVRVTVVSHKPNGEISLDEIERRIDNYTKIVALSHVQYGNGFRVNLRRLREITQGKCYLFLDAIQSLGAVKVYSDLCDFLSAGSYKWLLAPFGTGILYVNKEVELNPSYIGWASVEDPFSLSPELKLAKSARKFEIGNQDYSAIYGLNEALKFILTLDPVKIERRILDLTDILVTEAEESGLTLQTPKERYKRAGIVNIKVKNPEKIVEWLKKKGVIISARMNGLRISPHFYNDENELYKLITLLRKIILT